VLTWVSTYWFPRAGPAASTRIYYEFAHTDKKINFPETFVPVGPLLPQGACTLTQSASSLLRAEVTVVLESEHEAGGHFAAYERPEALVSGLQIKFSRSGPAADIVPG
ncbi:hypothetical protein BJY52DRAFT_1084404, partial [Lactarius psammicola]